MSKKTYYYHSESEDLVSSAQQDFQLPDDYQVFRKGATWQFWNGLVRSLACAFAWLYSRLFLLVKVKGKEKLRPFKKQGYFVYGNHTQMLGDPFTPMTIVNPYRYYSLAAQANWGIPFLGKYVIPGSPCQLGKTSSSPSACSRTLNTPMKKSRRPSSSTRKPIFGPTTPRSAPSRRPASTSRSA